MVSRPPQITDLTALLSKIQNSNERSTNPTSPQNQLNDLLSKLPHLTGDGTEKLELDPEMIAKCQPFKCPHCFESFARRDKFKQHLLTHGDMTPGNDRPRCPICSKSFCRLANVKRHIKEVHSEFQRPECDICHRTFGRVENLRRHRTEVHGCEGKQLSRSRMRLKDQMLISVGQNLIKKVYLGKIFLF